MKNIVSKFYVVAAFICSTAIVFAQEGPGDDSDDVGGMEGADNQAPIGDYAWILLVLGLVYVFYKLKSLSKQSNGDY